MAHPAFEETTVPVEVSADPDEAIDEAWVQTMKVWAVVVEVLDAVRTSRREGRDAHEQMDSDYLEALVYAFQAGERLTERHDVGEVRADMSRLDDEMLAEVRGSIGYVAPHFDIEIEFPEPGRGGGD